MYTEGDHVYFAGAFHVPSLYHHGVYVGNNQIAHFWGPSTKKNYAAVRLISTRDFEALAAKENEPVRVLDARKRLSREETVTRALSKLGASGYNFITNNCEHFVNWCVQGVAYSPQVNYQYKIAPVDPRATLRLRFDGSKFVYVEV